MFSKMSHPLKLVAILYLVSVSAAMAAPSCAEVTSQVAPCLSYIKGDSAPSKACCEGVVAVAKTATTKDIKVAICNCLKSVLKPIGTYDPSRIPPLPRSCGVDISLPPVDQNYDCSKVSSPKGLF